MYRVIHNFGYVPIDLFKHVVLPLATLIFLAFGTSFVGWLNQKKKDAALKRDGEQPDGKPPKGLHVILQILITLAFVAVGDVIAYFAFDLIYNNVHYQGELLKDRFPPGTEFPIIIYTYGFCLMLAFVVGTIFMIIEGKREKISADTILDMMTFIIIGSLIGARIVYFLLMQDEFRDQILDDGTVIKGAPWWDITRGGISIHGGILGAVLVGILFTRIRKLDYWKMADFVSVAVPLGIFIGRIGCFLNGCCFGKAIPGATREDHPWYAVFYPPRDPSLPDPPYPTDGLAHHPAQLYASLGALFLFFYLWYFRRNKSRFPGHTFFMFLLLYSLIRFFQEDFRFDASSIVIGTWLTVAQLASIIIFIISFIVIFEVNRRMNIAERLTKEMEGPGEVAAEAAPSITSPLEPPVDDSPGDIGADSTGDEEEGYDDGDDER